MSTYRKPKVIHLPEKKQVVLYGFEDPEQNTIEAFFEANGMGIILAKKTIEAVALSAPKLDEAKPEKKPEPAAPKVDTSQLTHTALGLFNGPKGWTIAKMRYDHKSQAVGLYEEQTVGPSRFEAEQRYRVTVANDIFSVEK